MEHERMAVLSSFAKELGLPPPDGDVMGWVERFGGQIAIAVETAASSADARAAALLVARLGEVVGILSEARANAVSDFSAPAVSELLAKTYGPGSP